MESVLNYIEHNKEKFLNELIEFLKIPSISSQPEHDSDTAEAAAWLVRHFNDIGIENVRIYETEGHPIVYAEWLDLEVLESNHLAY